MTTTSSLQILFIDQAVADIDSILAGLDPSIEVVLLNGESNGLEQIASAMEGRSGIEAIHIVSHGATGYLELGNSVLDLKTLDANAEALARIRAALAAEADLLLYGCEVGAGEAGAAFIEALAVATGADVAASVDITGPVFLGGDSNLEASTGPIEVAPLLVDALMVNLGTDGSLPSGLAGNGPTYS